MVKQFDQWCEITHGHRMTETDKGQYVLASDYDALAARLAEAESRLNLAEAEVTMLRHFNAEVEALLREARPKIECINCDGDWLCDECSGLIDRIDACLSPDSASHRENERE